VIFRNKPGKLDFKLDFKLTPRGELNWLALSLKQSNQQNKKPLQRTADADTPADIDCYPQDTQLSLALIL
jgi:hypothetical protein